jgi:hypothetical protein
VIRQLYLIALSLLLFGSVHAAAPRNARDVVNFLYYNTLPSSNGLRYPAHYTGEEAHPTTSWKKLCVYERYNIEYKIQRNKTGNCPRFVYVE